MDNVQLPARRLASVLTLTTLFPNPTNTQIMYLFTINPGLTDSRIVAAYLEQLKRIVGKDVEPVPDDEKTRTFSDALQKKSDSRLRIAFFREKDTKAPLTFLFVPAHHGNVKVEPEYNSENVRYMAILYEMQGDEKYVRPTDLPKYALKYEPEARLVRHDILIAYGFQSLIQ